MLVSFRHVCNNGFGNLKIVIRRMATIAYKSLFNQAQTMKKEYQPPIVEIVQTTVERGFAASAAIDNPEEVNESGDYWS